MDIGTQLNIAFRAIEDANPRLRGVFQDVDFANKERFPDHLLESLLQHFDRYRMRRVDMPSTVLGDAYEYLIAIHESVTEGSSSRFCSIAWLGSVTESCTFPGVHLTESRTCRHDPGMGTQKKSIEAESIERVRGLVLAHLRGEDARVYLFGSRARGDARAGSDIDVGVLPGTTLKRGLLAELREQLEELSVPYHVDIVNLAETSEAFRKQVLKEARLWHA